MQTIRARFTGWAARNVREHQWHRTQRLIDGPDGAAEAEFDLNSTVEFKRWLLGFGQHALVLKPKSLAIEIAAELSNARRLYTQ